METKRFNFSIKRMLVVVFMLVASVTGVQAGGYITDIMVIGGKKGSGSSLKAEYRNKGWTVVDKDLNSGAGGWDIYIAYKTSSTANAEKGYITDICASDKKIDSFVFEGRTYYRASANDGFNGDLNCGARGAYIYIYYTRQRYQVNSYGKTKRVITELSTTSSGEDDKSSTAAISWRNSKYSGLCEVNRGAGGDNIYIQQHFTTQTLRFKEEPVFASNLTFNGDAQSLIAKDTWKANEDYGTLKYRVNEGSWSCYVPSAVNVGNYKVEAYLDGTSVSGIVFANNSPVISKTVTINPPIVKAKDLTAVFNQGEKKVKLSWDVNAIPGNYNDFQWVVCRDGETIAKLNHDVRTYADGKFANESSPTYDIYYVSKFWDENTKRSDTKATVTVSTVRTIPVNNLLVEQQDDRLVFSWTSDGYSEGFGNQFWIYIDDEEDPVYKLKASDMQTRFRWEHRSTDRHDNRQNKVDEETGVPYTEEPLNACDGHTYRIEGIVGNKVLNTYHISTKAIGNATLFYDLDASKGVYEGSVRLSWHVDLQGSLMAKTYIVERRRAEQENEAWEMLARMSSNDEYLLFTDEKALPGVYYDYRVTVEDKCGDGSIINNEITDIGFAKSSGTLTGRIDFGSTGTAVQGVDVVMRMTSSEGDAQEQFHSLYFNDVNGAVTWQYPTGTYAADLFSSGNFTVQMWLFPEVFSNSSIVSFGSNIALSMTSGGQLAFTNGTSTKTFDGVTLKTNTYNHVVLTRSGTTLTCYVGRMEDNSWKMADGSCVMDGNWMLDGATQFELGHFKGSVDEFRLWTKCLSEAEIMENYDHLLVGNEKNLETYWTFDEGLRTQFFDYSRDGTNYRKHHGRVMSNAQSSNLTPSVLELKAKTDADGNYIIQGIPFAGEGTTYSVMPLFGVHEFNPSKSLLFVGKNALVHTANFEDVSSFPMSGHIYYAGTNVPVEGMQLYVDGVLQTSAGEVEKTDESGYYEISVPIGNHFVEAKLGGHDMVEGGRWPTRGTFYFDRAVQHDFADSTLVNFVGRVGGGLANDTLAVGLSLSKNNIGMATIQLALNNESFSFNCLDDHISDAPGNRYWESDTTSICSRAWTGTDYDAKYIYIRTDSLNGEFSALLPPLKYKVKSLGIDKSPDIDFGALPEIDLTLISQVQTDEATLTNEEGHDEKRSYSYNTKMVKTYFAEPQLELTQMTVNGEGDAPEGVFGRKVIEDYVDDFGTSTISDIWTTDGDGKTVYTYGYPIYDIADKVKMRVWGFEAYMNYDTSPAVADTIPLNGQVVTISNEMSSEQMVVARVDDESLGLKPGDIYDLKTNQLVLDTKGKNEFTFLTGLPNIAAPYTRQLSMEMERNERTYTYSGVNAVVLGSLTTGTNFVTLGPDIVTMVLRDPPGSSSKTTWTTGKTKTKLKAETQGYFGSETFKADQNMGAKGEVAAGMAVLVQTAQYKLSTDVGGTYNFDVSYDSKTEQTWSTTATRSVSTGTGNTFVGAAGDVFIGASTNIIVGRSRKVGFFRNGIGYPFTLDLRDAITVGDSIRTSFTYSTYELEKVMIPKWEDTRRLLFTFVKDKAEAQSYVNTSDHCIYATWLKEDDPRLGLDDSTYIQIIPENAPKDVAYPDSVAWCTDQIESWRETMAANERDKVEAMNRPECFRQNLSFDGGTTNGYSDRCDTTYQERRDYQHKMSMAYRVGTTSEETASVLYWKLVMSNEIKNGWHMATTEIDADDNYKDWAQFDYSFADGNKGTDFSVSVYKSPAGWSDSFFLLGGQSYNPYEGEERSKYYEPGRHILSNGTERMEIPDIRISLDGNGDNSAKHVTLSDVPAGQAGQLTLHLSNLSATNQGFDFSFNLLVQEKENQKGLEVFMDGVPANGRSIFIPAGETVKKTITLRQSDQSVLDYPGIEIKLLSQYQPVKIFDAVTFDVHFMPSSSPINLAVSDPVLNIETLTRKKGNLELKVSDFNRQFKGMRKLGVEYRYEGSTTWTQPSELQFVVNEADTATLGGKPLPATGDLRLTYNMSDANFYPQGSYTFRAYTTTMYGTEAVSVYSKEIEVVKDDAAPRQLATPAPANGILGYGDDMMVEFNEDIVPGYVSDKNIIVTAKLNSQKVMHDVAVQLYPAGGTPHTLNPVFLNGDFSIDFWMKWTMDGTILSIGSNQLAMGVDSEGRMVVGVAGLEMKSEAVIPKDTWTYIVLSYKSDEMTFSALAQYDTATLYLFTDQPVTEGVVEAHDYTSENQLYLGNMMGAIHDLSLFNIYRDPAEAAAGKYQSKDNYVYGLVNYWPMDEGHGTVARDTRHTHDFVGMNWLRDNQNHALSVDEQGADIDISRINTGPGDSYVIEMWYNSPRQPEQEQTVFEAGYDDSNRIGLYHNQDYDWILRYGGNELVVGNNGSAFDTDWNHVALNVVRGQSASFYFNGQRTAVIAEADVPPLEGAVLSVAKGAPAAHIDEVRIWHATRSESHLLNNIYNCIDTTDYYSRGLVAYYPFEKEGMVNGVTTRVETLDNLAPRSAGNTAVQDLKVEGTYSFSNTTPPVKNAPVESRLMARPIASERKVVISLAETSGINARDIEGTTLNITVDDIHDTHGNTSAPIRWTAYVQRNTLKWAKDSVTIIKQYGNDYYFDVDIVNRGGNTEYYTLYSMPQWLTLVDALDGLPVETTGDLAPQSKKTLRFKVMAMAAVGNYDVTIGLQGNDEILEPLRIVMKVRGEAPAWTVDPDLYENSMSIVGQVYVNGVLMSNSESRVAAFIDGECRGIAAIQPIRGFAFVALSVYGTAQQNVNGVMQDLDYGKNVTFRIWDAARGVTYTNVSVSVPIDFVTGPGSPTAITFDPSVTYGNFEKPVTFTKSNLMEQELKLKQNWNWISLNVEPVDTKTSVVFKDVSTWNVYIKDRATGTYYCNGTYWDGTLADMHANTMYKMKLTKLSKSKNLPTSLPITGEPVKLSDTRVTLKKNWNWIGYLPTTTMTLDVALAGANPQQGDQVKSQQGFAIYGPMGWDGNLTVMESGKGYLYYSVDDDTKEFAYPAASGSAVSSRQLVTAVLPPSPSTFTPVEPEDYPDNMSMVIRLVRNGEPVTDAELGAFIDDECHGAAAASGTSGLYYLLIAGEGHGKDMQIRAAIDGIVTTVCTSVPFNSDAIIGTPWEPFIIDLDAPSGISTLTPAPAADTEWYTLQGFKVGRRPTTPGVYIHRGQKVTILQY